MHAKHTVIIGLIGPTLDYAGQRTERWERWRPTVSLCQQSDLLVDRFELLCQARYRTLAEQVVDDIGAISPETDVRLVPIEFDDPWDFEQVYAALHEFARSYRFDTEREEYLVHITTGTHVVQICCFLLTEARYFPARLVQSSPTHQRRGHGDPTGQYTIIDLDLSRYDLIASRLAVDAVEGTDYLKQGIATRDEAFNRLISRIEYVAIHSQAPILLSGPTGAGKSLLARKIYELKHRRNQIRGRFVEVNCATVRGEVAMSTLFGHRRGAYTGATKDRDGLLLSADAGMLFLDEIGELGLDEQAMLLRALEERRFLPMGADQEISSAFQLIAGTNRALQQRVERGEFRADLLARINLWHFELPGLRERRVDIEPNLDFELERFAQQSGRRVGFNKEARARYVHFAQSSEAIWAGNFRDLAASVTRLATLSPNGRIGVDAVDEEIERLRTDWRASPAPSAESADRALIERYIDREIDRFDAAQLAEVIRVCQRSPTLSAAGRTLFAVSRSQRRSANDADRLRKYLARFDLSWSRLHAKPTERE